VENARIAKTLPIPLRLVCSQTSINKVQYRLPILELRSLARNSRIGGRVQIVRVLALNTPSQSLIAPGRVI
jgi:hypothetical protein